MVQVKALSEFFAGPRLDVQLVQLQQNIVRIWVSEAYSN